MSSFDIIFFVTIYFINTKQTKVKIEQERTIGENIKK